MSAWLVTKEHIDALVYARTLDKYRRDDHPLGNCSNDDAGLVLWRENMLSLAARYGDAVDEEALEAYRYARPPMPLGAITLSVVTLIKAVHCYAYQACEHDGWKESKAKAYCDYLLAMLAFKIPGYDKAPWGIDAAVPS